MDQSYSILWYQNLHLDFLNISIEVISVLPNAFPHELCSIEAVLLFISNSTMMHDFIDFCDVCC